MNATEECALGVERRVFCRARSPSDGRCLRRINRSERSGCSMGPFRCAMGNDAHDPAEGSERKIETIRWFAGDVAVGAAEGSDRWTGSVVSGQRNDASVSREVCRRCVGGFLPIATKVLGPPPSVSAPSVERIRSEDRNLPLGRGHVSRIGARRAAWSNRYESAVRSASRSHQESSLGVRQELVCHNARATVTFTVTLVRR